MYIIFKKKYLIIFFLTVLISFIIFYKPKVYKPKIDNFSLIDPVKIYSDYKCKKIIFSNKEYALVHFRTKDENSKNLIIISGFSDFWFHYDITDELFEKYNTNIYIIDTPNMGVATNSKALYRNHILKSVCFSLLIQYITSLISLHLLQYIVFL